MMTQTVRRKLAAVLHADVKGYSRLMSQNEVETVRTLKAHREIMFGLVRDHRGRVVDTAGDGFLLEFASVVDALECAVALQRRLKERNEELPANGRMQFRIGINIGDVIEEDEKIFGDGVNIAARLEGLAEPGGICISGTAYDQVRNKFVFGYEYLGEQLVKNIQEPVRVYKVLLEPGQLPTRTLRAGAAGQKSLRRSLWWLFYVHSPSAWHSGTLTVHLLLFGGMSPHTIPARRFPRNSPPLPSCPL